MALSPKLMTEGEYEVLTTRTHAKVLVWPVLQLLVLCALVGFLLAATRNTSQAALLQILVLVAGLGLLLWRVALPFARWVARTYTATNRRLVEQAGIITRTGRVIPWARVNDVAFERSLTDRLLGCGTLVIHDASEQTGLRLRDVPQVKQVHRVLSDLVFDSHTAGRDERYRSGDEPI